MQLIATRRLRYGTRRLQAGDTFEASENDGRLLVGIKKAKPASVVAPKPAPSVVEDPEIERHRQIAEGLGIAVDKRWGIKRLQAEIDAKRAAPGVMI